MYNFVSAQVSAQMSFHDKAVLKHIASTCGSLWMLYAPDPDIAILVSPTTTLPVRVIFSYSVMIAIRQTAPFEISQLDPLTASPCNTRTFENCSNTPVTKVKLLRNHVH
jgi:hypothetical protein